METSRKNLKIMSILILVFTGVSFVMTLVEFFNPGIDMDTIYNLYKDYATQEQIKELFDIMLIIYLVICVVFLLPQLYVGIKGLKIANKPKSATAHITWAKILLVLTVIGLIGCIVDIFGGTDLSMCITKAIDNLVDVAIYLYFIKYAKEVNDYL